MTNNIKLRSELKQVTGNDDNLHSESRQVIAKYCKRKRLNVNYRELWQMIVSYDIECLSKDSRENTHLLTARHIQEHNLMATFAVCHVTESFVGEVRTIGEAEVLHVSHIPGVRQHKKYIWVRYRDGIKTRLLPLP